jgi:hypothetical protein
LGRQLRLQVVENLFGKTTGIGVGLDHKRWDCADENSFGGPALAVAGQIGHHLPTAGGVTDVDGEVAGLDYYCG